MVAIGADGRALTTSFAVAGLPATSALIVTSPGPSAVTWPVVESTAASSGLLERQLVTGAGTGVPPESTTVPARVNVSPTVTAAGTPERLTVPGAGPTEP